MHTKLLILGFGYTAHYLAKQLIPLGGQVTGTTRNPAWIGQRTAEGVDLIEFSRTALEKSLATTTALLVSTPPSVAYGDPVLVNFRELIQRHASQLQWVGYLSSTGVYGDHQGAWVDESSPFLQVGAQAQLRIETERAWITYANEAQLPLHVFRLAGIYGPERNALARIRQGKTQTIVKENHFFSRIHVEDIARVLIASLQTPNPMSVYNVADDEPTPGFVVDDYAASLLGLPALLKMPFGSIALSPMLTEFYTHNRRVSNTKIKQVLGVQLRFPTFREGLHDIALIKP